FVAYEYQSKSMQRKCVLSLALVSTLAASGAAVAGPLSLNPSYPISQRAAPPAEAAPPVRPAAAQRQYGGGFFEFLFRGPGGGGAPPASYRPGEPADLGPGMVESPYDPNRAVMDPRYIKQEVTYDGQEAPGTIVINTRDKFLYLVQPGGRAIRYGIGVGRPGFTWAGVHRITNKREWPDWTPPDEMLKRRPDLPRHMAGGPDNPLRGRAMH